MDPTTGRFASEDPFEGDPDGPVSLHRYLYANGGPVNSFDPTGKYTADFGRAVERAIEPQYLTSHMGDVVQFGKWARIGDNIRLKPDILNFSLRVFNEIKPLSFFGISAGLRQMETYSNSLGGEGFTADEIWTPEPTAVIDPVSGRTVALTFINFKGIIFYTDIPDALKKISAVVLTESVLYSAINNSRLVSSVVDDFARVRGLISYAFRANVFWANEHAYEFSNPIHRYGI
jgi:hypothetical protein